MERQAKDSVSITRSQPFAAVIRKSKVDGSAALIVTSKRWYQHNLNKFQDNENVTLEIHNRRPKRTEQQNRYYWGVYLPLISQETGERDLDALHELFKGKFLSEGITEVLGEKVRKKKSTTELGVGDFCQYVLDIEELTGIAAPPTENWELAPLREGVKEKYHGKNRSETPRTASEADQNRDPRGGDSASGQSVRRSGKKRTQRKSNNRADPRPDQAEGKQG